MATTFKVGDKVRALNDCNFGNKRLYKGTEYTVTGVDPSFGYIAVNYAGDADHPASEFDLVPELPRINFYQGFKVGDIVKVTTKQFGTLIDVVAPITYIAGGMHYVKGVPLMRSEIELYKEPEYDFKPGDIVKPKTGSYFGSTVFEYVENAKEAYPKLTYTGAAVIYKRDNGGGYPSWDMASDVVLYERPAPVLEPERKDWTVLVERATEHLAAYKVLYGDEDDKLTELVHELRDALIEESYR